MGPVLHVMSQSSECRRARNSGNQRNAVAEQNTEDACPDSPTTEKVTPTRLVLLSLPPLASQDASRSYILLLQQSRPRTTLVMTSTLFQLNYDVLSDVLGLMSSHDAAQLALTCRGAYALALPRFLSDVSLGGLYHKSSSSAVSQLTDFCNFLLAPAPSWHGPPSSRLDSLRTLELMRDAVRVRKAGVWTTDASAVALLSNVLARANNLQKLTLWGSEALFKAYPDFGLGSSASIHALILGGDVAPLPALARAFPHVRQLIFIGGGACVPEWAFASPSVDPQALDAWRESVESIDTCFPVLPLAVPARRVHLRNPIVSDLDAIHCAREFLGRTRPVVLSTAMSAYASPEEFGAVLELAAPSLRYLELVGDRCENVEDGTEWVQARVANAFSLVPDLSLLGISLSVTPVVVSAMNRLKPYAGTPDAPRSDESRDLMGLVRALAASSPSLKFVAIDLSPAKGSSLAERAWFRVFEVKDSRSRHVVKISEKEGSALAEKMRAFNRYD
ncbi:hypothetical protein GSI_10553 [Ganoderma sinense ZZ0214-1]|uniref:F-box domain-containing protein n=1 Tax=Ganoderma sinense ZZ0214-1 TaxID=1077348 RepID=A0A2G8S0X7_9APHY|nr:hypothetical protein GSI_10553 [Ganoderma sinense ZZ0214-1]